MLEHGRLYFKCGCDAQVEYSEEEHEVGDVHCVPKVFEVLFGACVVLGLGFRV